MNHIIQIDDANAEMRLLHSNGCEVLLKTTGIVITSIDDTDITTTNTITIKGKDINITSTGSIKLTATGAMNLTAETITLKSTSNTMVI